MFTEKFDKYACVGDTISCEKGGFEITARIRDDSIDAEPPWDDDGHGPVSNWTSRGIQSGERVLISDGSACRYYDIGIARVRALRDGWDAPPYGKGADEDRVKRAVEADFEALRAWCHDEWFYCGLVLSVSRGGVVLDDHAAALWRIDLNHPQGDNSYLTEVANDHLDEAVAAGEAAMEAINA